MCVYFLRTYTYAFYSVIFNDIMLVIGEVARANGTYFPSESAPQPRQAVDPTAAAREGSINWIEREKRYSILIRGKPTPLSLRGDVPCLLRSSLSLLSVLIIIIMIIYLRKIRKHVRIDVTSHCPSHR